MRPSADWKYAIEEKRESVSDTFRWKRFRILNATSLQSALRRDCASLRPAMTHATEIDSFNDQSLERSLKLSLCASRLFRECRRFCRSQCHWPFFWLTLCCCCYSTARSIITFRGNERCEARVRSSSHFCRPSRKPSVHYVR